jgi:tRNA(fMet)-specific endonuclease VapC
LEKFLTGVRVLPISEAVDLYAEEKARLQKMGMRLDDFDLLIGVTAVVHRLTLVTNNTKHFERIGSIALEDWTIE